jgi:hypothetical protein
MIAGPDPRDATSLVDELVRISGPVAVVLIRDFVEYPAETARGRSLYRCHSLPPLATLAG